MRRYALIILNANHTLCLTPLALPLASGKGLKGELGTSNTVSHHPAALCHSSVLNAPSHGHIL